MNPAITKIKDGIVTLPQSVGKEWLDRDIMVFDAGDRLIIQPTSEAEWEQFAKRAEKGKQNISLELIDEAVQWAKKNA